MTQPNDLSRSLVPYQESTLIDVVDMSHRSTATC
jgi:hypothetical protein